MKKIFYILFFIFFISSCKTLNVEQTFNKYEAYDSAIEAIYNKYNVLGKVEDMEIHRLQTMWVVILYDYDRNYEVHLDLKGRVIEVK